MAPTLRAFASIHRTHRLVFSKMIDMNIEVILAKKIIALFIYLGQLEADFKLLLQYISFLETNDPFLGYVIAWAHHILSSLLSYPCFFTLWYPSAKVNHLRFIGCDREGMYKGLYEGLYGTYKGLFDDILEEKVLRIKTLDPDAKEWCPRANVDEASRSLFITLSKGLPLTCYQIRYFFTRTFGAYVESIYLHRKNGEPPLFGKIVFEFSSVPYWILNGRELVQFVINGRTLRCRKYIRMLKF